MNSVSSRPPLGPALPEAFEASAQAAAAQGDDGVNPFRGPVHASFLETAADGDLASGLDDPGADTKSLGPELGVPHAVTVFLDVGDRVLSLDDPGGIDPKGGEDRIDVSRIEFGLAFFDPREGSFALRTEDRLSDRSQVLLCMEEVKDLNGFGKMLVCDVPDPGSAVSDHDLTGNGVELAAGGFPEETYGKVGRLCVRVLRGGAFDCGGVGGGPFVPDRKALVIGRLRAPDDTELHLAGLGGAVGLFSGPIGQLLHPHRDSRPVGAEVEG